MRTAIACASAVILASSVAIAGAGQAPQSSQKPDEPVTTVIGCVQPGTTVEQFVLVSSTVIPDSKPAVFLDPQTGAAVASGITTKTVRYELVGEGSFDLAKLVGHRVEATGRVSPPEKGRPTSTPPVSDTRLNEREDLVSFRASTVRDVAPTC